MKTFRKDSLLSAHSSRRKSPFKRVRGRGIRWINAALSIFFGVPLALCFCPSRFNTGPLAAELFCANTALFLGMFVYGAKLVERERAAVIASALDAPEEDSLLIYIWASDVDHGEVRKHAAQILYGLLPQISEDKLARVGDEWWSRLCPLPRDDNPMGWPREDKEDREDLDVAVFSAIIRLKRMKSLPYIEQLMKSLDTSPHSDAYIRTLAECYQALLTNQMRHEQSAVLLRPSAETGSSDGLLRPVLGSPPFVTETGEQLLRASTGEDPCVFGRKETALFGAALEHERGHRADG